jgi:hypothetical protein
MKGMGRRVGRSWVGNDRLCQTMNMVADYQHLLRMVWGPASSSGGSKAKVHMSEKGQECPKTFRITSEVLAAKKSKIHLLQPTHSFLI